VTVLRSRADLYGKQFSNVQIRQTGLLLYNIAVYYMAVSHKDWELPDSRIWLAEIDIESGLDFPI